MNFDPDAFLAEPDASGPAPESTAFDPDAFLSQSSPGLPAFDKKAAERNWNVENKSNIRRGVESGWDESIALAHGFAGLGKSAVGNKSGAEKSFKKYQKRMAEAGQNPLDVPTFFQHEGAQAPSVMKDGDFDLGRFATWAGGTLGKLATMMGEIAISGVAGAAIGSQVVPGIGPDDVVAAPLGFLAGVGGKGAMKKMVAETAERFVKSGMKREMAEKAASQMVRKQVGKGLGAKAATTGFGTVVEAGGMWGGGMEEGYDNPWSALGLGLISGASESMTGVGGRINQLVAGKGISEAFKMGGAGTAAGILWETLKNAGEEGGQELFQEFLQGVNSEINDPNFRITDKANFMQWAEAGMAGALMGGVTGGAGGTFNAVTEARKNRLEKGKAVDLANDMEASLQGGVPGYEGVIPVGEDRQIGGPQALNAPDWWTEGTREGQAPTPEQEVRTGYPHIAGELPAPSSGASRGKAVDLASMDADFENTAPEPVIEGSMDWEAMARRKEADADREINNSIGKRVGGFMDNIETSGVIDDPVFQENNKELLKQVGQAVQDRDIPKVNELMNVLEKKARNRASKLRKKAKRQGVNLEQADEQNATQVEAIPQETTGRAEGQTQVPMHGMPTEQANIGSQEATGDGSQVSVVDNPDSVADLQEVNTAPSEAQKEAGNYKKAHAKIDGFDISVENPTGSTRSGTNNDGKSWSVEMQNDYGYIKGTTGYDKDHVDVFVAPGYAGGNETVHVVNQIDPATGKFDEHKVVFGASSIEQAREVYLSNYEKGWQGAESIVGMSQDQFKEWVRSDQPIKGKLSNPAEQGTDQHNGKEAAPTRDDSSIDNQTGKEQKNANETGAKPAKEPAPKAKQSKKSSITDSLSDAKQKRLSELKAKMDGYRRRMNSGIDPEMLATAMEITGLQIEAGVRTFAQYAKEMIDMLGAWVKPYLLGWWKNAKYGAEVDETAQDGMDDPDRSGAQAILDIIDGEEDVAPEQSGLTYEEFSKQYRDAFDNANKYNMDQVGSRTYTDKMAELADDHPEFLERFEEEEDAKAYGNALPDGWSESAPGRMATNNDPVNGGIVDRAIATGKWFAIPNREDLGTIEEFDTRKEAFDALFKALKQKEVVPEVSHHDKVFSEKARKIIKSNDSTQQKHHAMRKLADQYDISLKDVQERIESVLVNMAREITQSDLFDRREKFDLLLKLYNNQPLFSARTSTSVLNQAYSTPAPLAYAVGEMIGLDGSVYEPTAGTGMLTIGAGNINNVDVNEINEVRLEGLRKKGFGDVRSEDAAETQPGAKMYDRIITNPPFGKYDRRMFGRYGLTKIEHVISANAIAGMKDNGRAVMILGASRENGTIAGADKIFMNYLYNNFNVVANVEVTGDLYRKQGAAWPVRVIAIAGRKANPTFEKLAPKQVKRLQSWEEVFTLIAETENEAENVRKTMDADGGGISSSDSSIGGSVSQESIRVSNPSGSNSKPSKGRGKRSGTRGGTGSVVDGSGVNNDVHGLKGDGSKVSEQTGADGNGKRGRSSGSMERRSSGSDSKSGTDESLLGNDGQESAGQRNGNESGSNGVRSADRSVNKVSDLRNEYKPLSTSPNLKTVMPKFLTEQADSALAEIESKYGNIDDFVQDQLGYDTKEEMHKVLAGEQIDGVAMALHQVMMGRGMIIGDQTGIGKGRQAAAVMRWAIKNGKVPVFFTADPKLFSDMYADLDDIGSTVNPLLFGDPTKASIKSKDNELLIKAPSSSKRNATMGRVAKNGWGSNKHDAVFITYSQINKRNKQQAFLQSLIDDEDAVIILDESHLGSGTESTTALFLRGGDKIIGKGNNKEALSFPGILNITKNGVVYLSATFAKRPDSMPLYFKTDLAKAVDNIDELVETTNKGGVPLQQLIASALAKSGQYIRREKDFSGVPFNSKVATDIDETEVVRQLDESTDILREIIKYSHKAIEAIEELFSDTVGTANTDSSIGTTDFASVVHNQISQLLLASKADAVVDEAIEAHKRGEKPIITLMNTMGAHIEHNAKINELKNGDEIDASFKDVFRIALERTMRASEDEGTGDKNTVEFSAAQLGLQSEYDAIQRMIDDVDIDIPASPIDYIKNRLTAAGVVTGEITARGHVVNYHDDGRTTYGTRSQKEIKDKNGVVNRFNNGTTDALILNASGSTGLSLHASVKFKDQRPRHMIIAQPALDIAVFMQILGRILRSGMVADGAIYTNLMLPVEAEKRPAAVLAKKMKSMSANTTADSESSVGFDSVDFLNKYGDTVVQQILADDEMLQKELNLYPNVGKNGETLAADEGLSRKFTGRIALLANAQQKEIYAEIETQYNEYIQLLKETDNYDLEVNEYDHWHAQLVEDKQIEKGEDESSMFTSSVHLQSYSIKDTRKPPTWDDVSDAYRENIGSRGKWDARKRDTLESQEVKDANAAYIGTEEIGETDKEGIARASRDTGVKVADTRFRAIMDQVAPFIGQVVAVKVGDSEYSGLVTNFSHKITKGGNPIRLSSFAIEVMVNSPIKKLRVPLSKIASGEVSLRYDYTRGQDDFNADHSVENRITRNILVGNPIKGYLFAKRGNVVSFKTEEGKEVTGVLMPQDWKEEDLERDPRNELDNGAAVLYYLDKLANYGDTVSAGAVTIGVQSGGYDRVGGYRITVPASKRLGGKVYLNPKVMKLVGDFTKTGSRMSVVVDADRMVKFVNLANRTTGMLKHKPGPSRKNIDHVAEANEKSKDGGTSYRTEGTAQTDTKAGLEFNEFTAKQKREAVALLRKIFGDKVNIETVAEKIMTPEGQAALGQYRESWITLVDGRGDITDTAMHEAVHAAVDMFLTAEEKQRLLDAVGGDEEALAEGFVQYAKDRKGLPGKVKSLAHKLLRILRSLFGGGNIPPMDLITKFYDDLLSGSVAAVAPVAGNVAQQPAMAFREVDAEYMAAVERGDYESAQRLVNEAAELSGLPILQDDSNIAYKVRRGAPPKKTIKGYKLFTTKKNSKGEVYPLFVGANEALPKGVWLDAMAGEEAAPTKTGRRRVKSKLGQLAYRPGWHLGDIPLATHIGLKDSSGKVYARRANEVWAETEVSADIDYQEEANRNGKTVDGKQSVALSDIKHMPINGTYRYKTNSQMTGNWIIGGSIKITRVMSEAEVNEIIEQQGIDSMPWDGGGLNLNNLGLDTETTKNAAKLLDPVTYDNNGNVIPLSQRFNENSTDARYRTESMAAGRERPSQEQYDQVAKGRSTSNVIKENLKDGGTKLHQSFERIFATLSNRFEKLSPKLLTRVRQLMADIDIYDAEDLAAYNIWQKAEKVMTKEDRNRFDYARLNADSVTINEIIKKYGKELGAAYNGIRQVLDDFIERMEEVGLQVNKLKTYHPRVVKDHIGLLTHLRGTPYWTYIEQEINRRNSSLRDSGNKLTEEEQAIVADKMLRGTIPGVPASKTSHAKQRKITLITPDMMKFYADPDQSLATYIRETNRMIEWMKFFGTSDVETGKKLKRLAAVRKRLTDAIDKERSIEEAIDAAMENDDQSKADALIEVLKDATRNVFRQRGALENLLEELGLESGRPGEGMQFIENSIGAIANELSRQEKLTAEQGVELKELIEALWEDTGITNPILSFYRDTGLMAALGQFSSAITQLQDPAWSFFENGFWHSSREYGKALAKRSNIKRGSFAPDIMPEFSHTKKASWLLNNILQWTGMAYLDTAAKEGLANASVAKMQDQIKAAQNGNAKAEAFVRERLGQIFGDEFYTVMADIMEADPENHNVKHFAHYMVSEFQPLNRLETAEASKGNARILYMLKSYQIKQLNNYRAHLGRRLKKAMVNKDYESATEAMRAILVMAFWLAFLGAGADVLKDLIYGRKINPKELSFDVMGQMIGISRWDSHNIRNDGVSSALMKRLVPQNKIIDSVFKDLMQPDSRGTRTAGLMPVIGKFYYWRSGRGANVNAGKKNANSKSAKKKKAPLPMPSRPKTFKSFDQLGS